MSAVVVSSTYQPIQTLHDYGSGTSAVGVIEMSQERRDVRPIEEAARSKESKPEAATRNFVVTRILKGFISQNTGDTWRVVFVDNGRSVPYDLPAERLHKAGIDKRYQPFEMDELESMSPEIVGKVYRFRPLAKATEVFNETLPLDPDRQRKYDLIIARLGKSKG
jgi:hypothetical protein